MLQDDVARAPRERVAHIIATPAERQAWEVAAKLDGRTLSSWITRRCNGQPATAPQVPTVAPEPGARVISGARITIAEHEAWEAAAQADTRSLSAWIARRCNGQPATAPTLNAEPATKPSVKRTPAQRAQAKRAPAQRAPAKRKATPKARR